ncbi:HK97 gp10 family phage protein [Rhizobium sp. BK316]|uniref:HK97-gp10 family putative phage morphogenesis protein n=1 Tax=Rhizobium sp. BK316 TaxID=2587053 RepID=UPI00160A3D7D|nr:HK97-gp10 family putative phage morphogenesis protein [Rhizobium sp. BK316]MBB3410664.1 HK97 gp10 family phage protein [Rhizobium sp. BK316]
MAKVTISGMKELRQQLLKTIPDIVKAEIQSSLEKSGEEMVRTAKALAPVEDGSLRDSISVTTAGNSIAGGKEVGELSVRVVAEEPYAAFVEFGRHEKDGQGAMSARPFFWPAYRSIKKRIQSRTARSINAALKKLSK